MASRLEETQACWLRDQIIDALHEKKVTLKEVGERLRKCEELKDKRFQAQIIQMVQHNELERITCKVELELFGAVTYHMIDKIIKEELSNV